jgi:hypothetical protein
LLGCIVGKIYERSTLSSLPLPVALQEKHFCVSGKVNYFSAALERISFEKGDVHGCKSHATKDCPTSNEFLEWRLVS